MKTLFRLSGAIVTAFAIIAVAGCASGSGGGGPSGVGAVDQSGPVTSSLSQRQMENVAAAFAAAYRAAVDREFDPGNPVDTVHADPQGVLVQNFEGGDEPAIFAMADADAWYAHLLRGPIAAKFIEAGSATCGAPVSDEYPFGTTGIAQRFEKGVITAEGDSVTFTPQEWIPPDVPDEIGRIRSEDPVLDEIDDARLSAITRAFREAYVTVAARGVDPGTGSVEYADVHQWDGPIVQNLEEGGSPSFAWGIPNAALLFIQDPQNGRYAYFVQGPFADKMTIGEGIGAHNGAHGYGGAISNEYRCGDGDVCQAFGKGIMQLNPQTGVVEFIPYF